MFQQSSNYRSKQQLQVELRLHDGKSILGKVSVALDQRVSDLMNDPRQFIPVESSDGSVVILSKTTIAQIVPLDQQKLVEKETDPYKILGVPRDISDEKLAAVYRSHCAQNHPDKVQAARLSTPFLQLAHSRMVRIGDAYQRIIEQRKAAEEPADA